MHRMKMDYFSDNRIDELSRILKIVDEYIVRSVPSDRINEVLWKLNPELSSHSIEMQPCIIARGHYNLLVSKNGVKHA